MTHATLVRCDDLRPPFVALVADIGLREDGGRPRWWLVAETAGPGTAPIGATGVHSVEVAPRDGVLVGHFAGVNPFGALRLDAGGELTLHGWTVTVWDDPPVDEVEIDVVSAADLVVGGRPAADWLKRGTWLSESLEPLAIELVDPRREPVRVAI